MSYILVNLATGRLEITTESPWHSMIFACSERMKQTKLFDVYTFETLQPTVDTK